MLPAIRRFVGANYFYYELRTCMKLQMTVFSFTNTRSPSGIGSGPRLNDSDLSVLLSGLSDENMLICPVYIVIYRI
jgi:hypothetical protein